MEEEREVVSRPLDFNEIFGGETKVSLVLKGYTVRFHFRELDSTTDIEYQRRQSKTKNKNGKLDIADEALTADLWLFDQLCTAVEVIDGDGAKAVPDFKTRIAPDVRRTALFHYRQRVTKDEAGN